MVPGRAYRAAVDSQFIVFFEMPAIYTRGGDTLNENILLKIFAFDDSASDARTPCIARGWDAVRRGAPVLI